jgi:hypothetical protein
MLENLAEHPPISGGHTLIPAAGARLPWLWRKVRSDDGSKVAAAPQHAATE